MTRLTALAATELRLLVRDGTVLVFAFLFPAFVMLVLAGVFGTEPDDGFAMRRPDDYYVVASIGIPALALTLIGLPVALASYRERGVLRRLEAFGVPAVAVVAAQAVVCCLLVVLGAVVVLAVAAPTYGVPAVADPAATAVALGVGLISLLLLGVAVGLAVPNARAAQAVGLALFFPLYLLGGGGPPRGAMPDAMQSIAEALPAAIPAISDPWLGTDAAGLQLVSLAGWALVALAAIAVITRRA